VVNENRRGQLQSVALTNGVSFEKLQSRLFGALPIAKMLPESVVAPGGLALAHILARMRGSDFSPHLTD
jgi:hypothetical protein